MKKNISLIILLALLLPLTSCNSLENVEIVAGEFPKGGKEISYEQLKIELATNDIDALLPNAMVMEINANKISKVTSSYEPYINENEEVEYAQANSSITFNNLNYTFKADGLTNATKADEYTSLYSIDADMEVKIDNPSLDENGLELLNNFNGKTIEINEYINDSKYYFSVDSTTYDYLYSSLIEQDIVYPRRFYIPTNYIFDENAFPILEFDEEKSIINFKQYHYMDIFPSFGVNEFNFNGIEDSIYKGILAEAFFTFKKYDDGYIAVLDINKETFVDSVINVTNKFHENYLLHKIVGKKVPLSEDKLQEHINTTIESASNYINFLENYKVTYRFDKTGISEFKINYLYNENIPMDDFNAIDKVEIDLHGKFNYYDTLEIEEPKDISKYVNLIDFFR